MTKVGLVIECLICQEVIPAKQHNKYLTLVDMLDIL